MVSDIAVNGNPNPSSNGKTLTTVLFHIENNSQISLFDPIVQDVKQVVILQDIENYIIVLWKL
ncbi:MAG: hypothetical protein LBI72_08850 [Flavobacteriaceae bacterium]|nr:hypothetical protein [Flavobacteriaceae bacterium]